MLYAICIEMPVLMVCTGLECLTGAQNDLCKGHFTLLRVLAGQYSQASTHSKYLSH